MSRTNRFTNSPRAYRREREGAGLQPGEVEQPLEQHLHVACLVVGDFQVLRPLLRRACHPVPQALQAALHRGKRGAQVVGDARHHVGAGPLVDGVLLPLLQQAALHPVKGGADRSELVLPAIAHRPGVVPRLHPPRRVGQGLYRAEDQLDQTVGGDQAESRNDHNRCCGDDGHGGSLRLPAVHLRPYLRRGAVGSGRHLPGDQTAHRQQNQQRSRRHNGIEEKIRRFMEPPPVGK